MTTRDEPLVARRIEDEGPLTLAELCRVFDVHADFVIEMVEVGVVEPFEGRRPSDWRFPAQALVRMRRAIRLREDLAVDPAGAALALDLIEELRELRTRLRVLERGRGY